MNVRSCDLKIVLRSWAMILFFLPGLFTKAAFLPMTVSGKGNKTEAIPRDSTYSNPIIPGFNPDPSICRVGKDFYLATSSFEYFPGVPIYHSTDLVNWEMIGHVLQRASQLNLDSAECSGGIYAPTIRYNQGTFYMVTTLVGKGGGNFIVTAQNIKGPWSDPHWFKNAPGIDPSLFFDDDGKVYMSGNEKPEIKAWPGHNNIWIQELDLQKWQLIGEKRILVNGADFYNKGTSLDQNNPAFLAAIEGAHLYKKDGMYYPVFSHGGTGHNHAVSILRGKNITGPFESNPANPIITHRDLSKVYPITATGHADLVNTSEGDWWLVYLGKRPNDGEQFMLGRETFLSPVDWKGEWPVVNPKGKVGRSELVQVKPDLKGTIRDNNSFKDDFITTSLLPQWIFIRTPRTAWWSQTEHKSFLRIHLRPEKIIEKVNPSFIGKRMEHFNFSATAKMEFKPQLANEEAGIMIQRDRFYNLRLTLQNENGKNILKVILNNGPALKDSLIASSVVNSKKLILKVTGVGLVYSFSYSTNGNDWVVVKDKIDCTSNDFVKGGKWTGSFVGMYASSNGKPSTAFVDFDWFDYKNQ